MLPFLPPVNNYLQKHFIQVSRRGTPASKPWNGRRSISRRGRKWLETGGVVRAARALQHVWPTEDCQMSPGGMSTFFFFFFSLEIIWMFGTRVRYWMYINSLIWCFAELEERNGTCPVMASIDFLSFSFFFYSHSSSSKCNDVYYAETGFIVSSGD